MAVTIVLALGNLGHMTKNRNNPISVVPPKLAKESTIVTVTAAVTGIIVLTFTNGNMALERLYLNLKTLFALLQNKLS
jgi:hypothetical protein